MFGVGKKGVDCKPTWREALGELEKGGGIAKEALKKD